MNLCHSVPGQNDPLNDRLDLRPKIFPRGANKRICIRHWSTTMAVVDKWSIVLFCEWMARNTGAGCELLNYNNSSEEVVLKGWKWPLSKSGINWRRIARLWDIFVLLVHRAMRIGVGMLRIGKFNTTYLKHPWLWTGNSVFLWFQDTTKHSIFFRIWVSHKYVDKTFSVTKV